MKDKATDEISDGYHTFGELYEHRRALNAALFAAIAGMARDRGVQPWVWRSKRHHPIDGPIFEGYFVVGADLPAGQISYHYKLAHWDDFAEVPELEHAPRYDRHTPGDVVQRLLGWARRSARSAP